MTFPSVVVVNSYGFVNGGATRVAVDEAVGLAERGVRVTLLTAVGPVSDELNVKNLRVLCLGQKELIDVRRSPVVALQGIWNLAAYNAMRQLLGHSDPRSTIIHVHGFSQALSASPVTCALRMRFEVVHTLHDYFSVCPNGAFFDFPSRTECTLHPLSLLCATRNCDKRSYTHKLYRLLKTNIQRKIGTVPDKIRNYIALSTHSAEKIRRYLPPDSRVFQLPNPCLITKTRPVDVGANQAVAAIGRLDPEKGIELLVKAAEIVRKKILFVGDGPLRNIAAARGLNEVTGWLPRPAVLEKLETARCLVFPSLWPETYGLTVMDAAARGIPAIVSDVSGIAERVEDGVTGWHVRPGDLNQLVNRLQALDDSNCVSAAGAAAYNRFWTTPLTRENHISSLLEIYDAILSDNSDVHCARK